MNRHITYLTQSLAQAIDVELMSTKMGFSLTQLMELAGLSVAQAAMHAFPLNSSIHQNKVVVCCGPGNNGGDGLVAARHLFHFGYEPVVICPKFNTKSLFADLIIQLNSLNVPVISGTDAVSNFKQVVTQSYFIIDAIFGFSFSGPIKAPFDTLISNINASNVPVMSVDIPSGWDVEKGCIDGQDCIRSPYALISLTAPKLGALNYKGVHYVGGRFVPPEMGTRLGLNLPQFPGSDQIVQL